MIWNFQIKLIKEKEIKRPKSRNPSTEIQTKKVKSRDGNSNTW